MSIGKIAGALVRGARRTIGKIAAVGPVLVSVLGIKNRAIRKGVDIAVKGEEVIEAIEGDGSGEESDGTLGVEKRR